MRRVGMRIGGVRVRIGGIGGIGEKVESVVFLGRRNEERRKGRKNLEEVDFRLQRGLG